MMSSLSHAVGERRICFSESSVPAQEATTPPFLCLELCTLQHQLAASGLHSSLLSSAVPFTSSPLQKYCWNASKKGAASSGWKRAAASLWWTKRTLSSWPERWFASVGSYSCDTLLSEVFVGLELKGVAVSLGPQ